MDDIGDVETVDLDGKRFIQLEPTRQWPKYVVAWSVRQRVGDSNFPLAAGSVERMPAASDSDAAAMWNDLRQSAMEVAMAAASSAPSETPHKDRKSILGRILGRE